MLGAGYRVKFGALLRDATAEGYRKREFIVIKKEELIFISFMLQLYSALRAKIECCTLL